MKKYSSKMVIALAVGYCLLQAGQVWADSWDAPVSAADGNNKFSGYSAPAGSNLTGIVVTYSASGQLQSVVLQASSELYSTADANLYINIDSAGQYWNYLVQTANGNDPVLYDVASPYNYIVKDLGGGKSSPDGIKATDITPATNITGVVTVEQGYDAATGVYSLIYNFGNLDPSIDILAATFTVGWTSYTTDYMDAVYVKPKWGVPNGNVPEPVTMVLFGTGITALAGWRMRRGKIEDK